MMQLQQIAEHCQQGDREAFAMLYTAMRQPLRTVCLSYVHDEDVADDLLHDAFMLMFFQIGKLRDTSRTEAWMTMVMRRVSLLYLRKQRQRGQKPSSDRMAKALESLTVDNDAESALAVQEILAAVDSLPEGYRQVFRLSVIEGMTHQEIAALTGIEPHSSSSQLVRAKDLLRRWLRHSAPLILALMLSLYPYPWQNDRRSPNHILGGESNTPKTNANPDKPQFTAVETQVPQKSQKPQLPQKSQPPQSPQESQESQASQLPQSPQSPQSSQKSQKSHNSQSPQSSQPSQSPQSPQHQSPLIPSPILSTGSSWAMSITYSGIANGENLHLPYADNETNPLISDSVRDDHIPLTLGITFSRSIDKHWRVDVGIRYERMTSDILTGNTYVAHSHHQLVQYVTFPVGLSWHQPLGHRFSTYLSASVSFSLPLHSTLESVWLMDGKPYQPTSSRLHPPVQWAAGISGGLQYDLTPHLGLFAEPGLNYHFGGSSDNVKTWNTEHPFNLSIPLGLRISF